MRLIRAALVTVAVAGLIQLVAVFGAAPAVACSCVSMSDREYVEGADVIFKGTLLDREEPEAGLDGLFSSADPATLTFAVSEVYKGQVGPTAQVRTAMSGASCGLEIEGEGPFLVFTEFGDDGLTASLCGGTRDMPEEPPAALGDPRPPAGSGEPASFERTSGTTDSGGAGPMVWVTGGAAVALAALLAHRIVRRKPDQKG